VQTTTNPTKVGPQTPQFPSSKRRLSRSAKPDAKGTFPGSTPELTKRSRRKSAPTSFVDDDLSSDSEGHKIPYKRLGRPAKHVSRPKDSNAIDTGKAIRQGGDGADVDGEWQGDDFDQEGNTEGELQNHNAEKMDTDENSDGLDVSRRERRKSAPTSLAESDISDEEKAKQKMDDEDEEFKEDEAEAPKIDTSLDLSRRIPRKRRVVNQEDQIPLSTLHAPSKKRKTTQEEPEPPQRQLIGNPSARTRGRQRGKIEASKTIMD